MLASVGDRMASACKVSRHLHRGLQRGPSLLPLPCERVWMERALTIACGLVFVYSGSLPWLMTFSWLFLCCARCLLGDHCFHFSGFHFPLTFGKPSKLMLLVGGRHLREMLFPRADACEHQQLSYLLTWGRQIKQEMLVAYRRNSGCVQWGKFHGIEKLKIMTV